VIALDLAGIQVSAGAACSSGKVARSHVLDAMGLGVLAGEAIRVSLPWNAAATDADAFLAAYASISSRLARRAA
jgi:cysteine desulfurase